MGCGVPVSTGCSVQGDQCCGDQYRGSGDTGASDERLVLSLQPLLLQPPASLDSNLCAVDIHPVNTRSRMREARTVTSNLNSRAGPLGLSPCRLISQLGVQDPS